MTSATLEAVSHRKFGFRRTRAETGLASIANPHPSVHIKLGKLIVGEVSAPSRFGHENWLVRLIVEDPGKPGDWRWVTLRAKFPNEAAARLFVSENEAAIRERYALATCGEDEGND